MYAYRYDSKILMNDFFLIKVVYHYKLLFCQIISRIFFESLRENILKSVRDVKDGCFFDSFFAVGFHGWRNKEQLFSAYSKYLNIFVKICQTKGLLTVQSVTLNLSVTHNSSARIILLSHSSYSLIIHLNFYCSYHFFSLLKTFLSILPFLFELCWFVWLFLFLFFDILFLI